MSVIKKIEQKPYHEPGPQKYAFWCPGCRHAHWFDSTWNFNGDLDKPTVTPSILMYGDEKTRIETQGRYGHLCHVYVTDGMIHYLDDCTHWLKGQVVSMHSAFSPFE